MNSTTNSEILCTNFNQDQGIKFRATLDMFAVGTDNGFHIFTSLEPQEKLKRDLKGGIGIVEMLYRSNIMALVGGGLLPKYSDKKVIFWDDNLLKSIGEISFSDQVKNVKLNNDKVIVVLEKKTFVYNFSDLKLLDQIDTCSNPRGIVAVNVEGDTTILAIPDKQVGRVLLTTYEATKDQNSTQTVNAHQSPISFLCLNALGTRLATASDKGTVIRVYDTKTGESMQELRRGSDQATITSIAFDFHNQWLACASDQGTIHIFGLKNMNEKEKEQTKNPKSKLGFLGSMIPILKSEWSFAQLKVQDSRCKVIFTKENTFMAVSQDGNFFKAQFDPEKGGECQKLEHKKFMQTPPPPSDKH